MATNDNTLLVELCDDSKSIELNKYINEKKISCTDYKVALNFCSRTNKVKIFKMLYQSFRFTFCQNDTQISNSIIYTICQYGSDEILKYVIDMGILSAIEKNCGKETKNQENIYNSMKECVKHNYNECFKMLYPYVTNFEEFFELAAKNGNIEVVKMLTTYYQQNEYDVDVLNDIYIECTKNNRMELLLYLLKYFGNSTINFGYRDGFIIVWPCYRQHRDMFLYLITNFNERLTTDIKNNLRKVLDKNNNSELISILEKYD